MKFATLAMVIATAAAGDAAAAAPKQCHAIATLAAADTCLCDASNALDNCLTTG